MYDVIIVGGGPAGLTAALYALRNNKTALVIEKAGFGGQITYSPKVENYPGTKQMSGNEFADKFLDQVLAQGAEVETDTVTAIRDEGSKKIVVTECGEFEGKAVVLATGVKHRMLGVEGEYELVGNGLSFCAVCDGDFYRGKRVAVIGGGNSALQEATLLADVCESVVLVQNLDDFTGERRLVEGLLKRANVSAIVGTTVEGFLTEGGELKGLKLCRTADGAKSELACDGLFVAIGLIPENEAFADLTELDKFGYFASGEDCRTKTEGIYCAGDCRAKSVRQLTTAVADGAVAALAACRYIDSQREA